MQNIYLIKIQDDDYIKIIKFFKQVFKLIVVIVLSIIFLGCKNKITNEEIEHFRKAIENNEVDYINKIIDSGLDINDKRIFGYIPLFEAVKKNNIYLIELFLNHNADINIIDEFNENCLFKTHNIDVIKYLIDKGANVNQEDNFGNIPLSYCLWNLHLAKLYIDNGSDINKCNKGGDPLLFIALWEGKKNVIDYLLNRSHLRINVKNKKGENALIWYSYFGYDIDIFEKLLSKGLNINIDSDNGVNALIASIIFSDRFKLNVLKKNYFYITHILQRGIDVNHQDKLGNTALHYAVIRERPAELVALLLKYGARKDIRNKEGKTPLDIAIEKGNSRIIDMLKI